VTTGIVAVLGSINVDLIVTVDRMPAPGETLLGLGLERLLGGKGANQALASALIAKTSLIGKVGSDLAGGRLRDQLDGGDIDVQHVRFGQLATGYAVVTVNAHGENSIIVIPMANFEVEARDVKLALDSVDPTVVLCQLEVPPAAVRAAAEWAESKGRRFILNPSPISSLDPTVLAQCDPVIVNAGEASEIAGHTGSARASAQALADSCRSVVVTDGSRGAWVAYDSTIMHIPGIETEVIDTTGAGDIFAGTLAALLSTGASLAAAAREANLRAAHAVGLSRSSRATG
jgi:ribokinase